MKNLILVSNNFGKQSIIQYSSSKHVSNYDLKEALKDNKDKLFVASEYSYIGDTITSCGQQILFENQDVYNLISFTTFSPNIATARVKDNYLIRYVSIPFFNV